MRPVESRYRDIPSLGEAFRVVFRSARPAWNPSFLFPLWLITVAAWFLLEVALPAVDSGTGGGFFGLAIRGVAGVLLLVLGWLLAALVVAVAAWEFGRGERLGVADGLRTIRARWSAVFLGPLLVPLGAFFLLFILVGGSKILSLLPVVGNVLVLMWLLVVGFPLALIVAGLLLLGIPALPLIFAAGAVEQPYPFDAASRGMSYLRARPSRYLAILISGLLGMGAGTAVFTFFAVLVLFILVAAQSFAASTSSGFNTSELWGALAAADLAWPLTGLLRNTFDSSLLDGGSRMVVPMLVGRAVTAFACVAGLSALSRIYLLMRWDVDGEPPGSQVHPGERFHWVE